MAADRPVPSADAPGGPVSAGLERGPVRSGAMASISTRRGDTGTTGLLHGGRVSKDSRRIWATGTVDEAQAALGLARAEVRGTTLDDELVALERDLWVLMAELATAPRNRRKLIDGATRVTAEMVDRLGRGVSELEAAAAAPAEFVVPGQNRAAAGLDLARTIVRRAERIAVGLDLGEGAQVVPYLNRLSDLLWLMARRAEGEHLRARAGRARRGPSRP